MAPPYIGAACPPHSSTIKNCDFHCIDAEVHHSLTGQKVIQEELCMYNTESTKSFMKHYSKDNSILIKSLKDSVNIKNNRLKDKFKT